MESEEIGGFLGFELDDLGSLFHDKAIAVNTGRNALEYIIRANHYSKIYLPYFTCDAVLEPIKKLNVDFSFYSIDKELYPKFDFSKIKRDEGFIYTNYFGLFNANVDRLISECDNLILDNAQAFFCNIKSSTPAFYSPRKFFGVPDGGFLYNPNKIKTTFESDSSLKRLKHLVGRIEQNAENFYSDYQRNEEKLHGEPIKYMSKFTKKTLRAVNYENVKKRRQKNYQTLHKVLHRENKLKLPNLKQEVPLCYPLLLNSGFEIKQKLIQKKIYVPTYWPNVLEWTNSGSLEYDLAKNLVCLPLDQRYGKTEMQEILKMFKSHSI